MPIYFPVLAQCFLFLNFPFLICGPTSLSLYFLLTGYACLLFPDFLIPYLMFLVICELLKTSLVIWTQMDSLLIYLIQNVHPPTHNFIYHFRGQSHLQAYVWMPWDARHPELTMLFMDDFSTLEVILQTQDSESGKINYAFSYKLKWTWYFIISPVCYISNR